MYTISFPNNHWSSQVTCMASVCFIMTSYLENGNDITRVLKIEIDTSNVLSMYTKATPNNLLIKLGRVYGFCWLHYDVTLLNFWLQNGYLNSLRKCLMRSKNHFGCLLSNTTFNAASLFQVACSDACVSS